MTTKKLSYSVEGDQLNKVVFFTSSGLILLFSLVTIFFQKFANEVITEALAWVSSNFGWYFLLAAFSYAVFVILVACSHYGKIKLGPKHSKPEFGIFAWSSMLFAAGIGIDLMFFSVAEPVTQYMHPPQGTAETVMAAREAVVWALFHYGLSGWCMYALMGMAMGYFSYRYNLPLTVRSALYPIFGKKIEGWIGHIVDIAALLGAIFGIATTLGIGVMQLNYGLNVLFDFKMGLIVQIGLITLSVLMAMVSAISGINKGIRILSVMNVYLALALVLFLIVFGNSEFLLNAFVLNIGDYINKFPDMMLNSFAFDNQKEWMSAWTLFFWAWWVAWAPFVGLFLARISRGRTIRQFVAGTLIIPFIFTLIWISVFGNSALYQVIIEHKDALAQEIVNFPERGFYSLLAQYPAFKLTAILATFTGLMFYVTSADSGALVLGNFSSKLSNISRDAPNRLRVFWSIMIGLLTVAMLMANGITALQNATVTMGLPFSFVMILIMIGLFKSFRLEDYRQTSQNYSLLASQSSAQKLDWKQRLVRIEKLPNAINIRKMLDNVCWQALSEIAEELKSKGTVVKLSRTELDYDSDLYHIDLTIICPDEQNFIYQIWPQQYAVPPVGNIVLEKELMYFKLESYLLDGGQGNDLMWLTKEQLINEVLDQYERHQLFLHLTREAPGDSLIFPDPN